MIKKNYCIKISCILMKYKKHFKIVKFKWKPRDLMLNDQIIETKHEIFYDLKCNYDPLKFI